MFTSANIHELVPVKCNTEDREIFANIRSALSLGLPVLDLAEANQEKAVIVGGGPSMHSLIPMIRAMQTAGYKVYAINGSMKHLLAHGIEPDFFVMLDARLDNLRFIIPNEKTHYLIASQCHPSVFEALKGNTVTVWHPHFPEIDEIVGREVLLIGGGTTVGLQAMSIAYALGSREIHLFGFDSSYEDDEGHAYPQALNDQDKPGEVWVAGKRYMTTAWMLHQAMQFADSAKQLVDGDCEIHVHGNGLMTALAHNITREPITVLTVYKSGGQYTPEYVTRLKAGVESHLTIPHRFVCMTDEPIDGVECIPLAHDFPGWWSKAEIFRPDLPFERVFYLDLSCVVTGLLDEMAMQEGRVITSDWYHGGPSQSVLLYNVGDFTNTWETFMANPDYWMDEGGKMIAPNFGDQILMRRTVIPKMDYWQDRLPGHLVSFKVHGVPDNARLIKFHGQPKPSDVGWLESLPLAKAG